MSSLPGALDFAQMEEEICERWKLEDTFKMQDKLSLERNDEVSAGVRYPNILAMCRSCCFWRCHLGPYSLLTHLNTHTPLPPHLIRNSPFTMVHRLRRDYHITDTF